MLGYNAEVCSCIVVESDGRRRTFARVGYILEGAIR